MAIHIDGTGMESAGGGGGAVDAYTKAEMDEILGPIDEALDEMIEALLIFAGVEE